MDSVDATKKLICLLSKQDNYINITKLEKLLYIFYGYSLLMKDKPVLNEQPKCFEYGPLFWDSYKFLKNKCYDFDFKNNIIFDDDELEKLFNTVFEKYGQWTASQLVEWCCRKGSAWYITNKHSNKWGDNIEDYLVKKEFEMILN